MFSDLVFGPLKSRRLGVSLGINLLPHAGKICSFECIYCECGWTQKPAVEAHLPKREDIYAALESKLRELKGTQLEPESLTFSGNGEPTLHPQFAEIIDDVIELRNKYCPKAVVSVLTNGTMAGKKDVFEALCKIDNNIIKLDGGTQQCIEDIDQPKVAYNLEEYVKHLQKFNGNLTIQTLFLRGKHNGKVIDNTTPEEVEAWLRHLCIIKPRLVMMYVIERATPEKNLEKISKAELEAIAEKVNKLGIETKIYA